jgi:hypothetical protein
MDLKEIEWADGDYNMAQDMDLWSCSCEQGNEPSGSIKILSIYSVTERLMAVEEGSTP